MLLQVFLTGCAFQQAIHRGDKLAASGDWQGAYAAYTEATDKKPEDEEAVKARDGARDQVVESELSEAKIALDRGAYEDCKAHLDQVSALSRDEPAVFDLTVDLERTMGVKYDQLWKGDDAYDAYDLAVRASRILPKATFLAPAFDQLRGYYTDQAQKLLAAKEHENALKAITTITHFEPDRASEVAPIEQKIRLDWADTLAARAAALAKWPTRIGAAAVWYVRAYEVAGRESDLERSKPLLAKLRDQGRLGVQLDVVGAPARVGPLRDAIVAGLAGVPDAAVVRSAPALALRVTLQQARCSEQDEVTPSSLDYVSGQVEKPNPDYVDLSAQIAKAKADQETARGRVTALEPDVAKAEATVKAFDDKLAAASKAAADAKAASDTAHAQLDATRKQRDDLQAQVDQLQASGGSADELAALRGRIVVAEGRLGEWGTEVTKHDAALDAAEQQSKAVEAQRAPAVEARDRLKAGYEAAVQERDAASQLAAELSTRLANTPKTVWEDVHETLKYDVHDWTRTCPAPASAVVHTTWKTTQPTSHAFAPVHTTTDRSHIGHDKAKLELDPKAYPETDAQLVAAGDDETSKELVGWLTALVADGYRSRVDQAIDQAGLDPVAATTPVLALWLGAKDRLDATTQGAVVELLTKQYGLEHPDLLGGG